MSLHLVTLCLALVADEPLSPQKAAAVTREQAKAQADVAAKYGNKKSSELTPDERRQMIKDQTAAEKQVLEKHGVDAKTWARESIKRDRAQLATAKAEEQKLAEKEQKDAEDAKKPKEQKPITVQKGFSDENPVTLEEKDAEEGKVAVEKGLPPGTDSDQEAAAEQDRLEGSGAADDGSKSAPKAAPKGKGGGRRK
jgi:hypothetical protein